MSASENTSRGRTGIAGLACWTDVARLVAEAEQQDAQGRGEVVLLVLVEPGEDASFVVEVGDDGAVDELAAGGREGDDDATPVGGVDVARDIALGDEPVEPVGDGARAGWGDFTTDTVADLLGHPRATSPTSSATTLQRSPRPTTESVTRLVSGPVSRIRTERSMRISW